MEQPMSIKDLLVHVDQSPTTATRLDAALELGERFGAHVTALHLIAEPFMRNMAGYHLPADILRIRCETSAPNDSLKAAPSAVSRCVN
jgi:hypothetical protein